MTKLTALRIGKTMEKKLQAVGIDTAEALIETGSREAFERIKGEYPGSCAVILYHLEAAIEDVEIKELAPEKKAALRQFYQDMWPKKSG